MLSSEFKVEIIGPMFGDKIWEPLSNHNKIRIKYIKCKNPMNFYIELNKFLKLIGGDIIYASKPLLTSFGLGLIKKFIYSVPLILDIDDRDIAFYLFNSKLKTIKYFIDPRMLLNPINPISTLSFEKLRFIADRITVAGENLRRIYGGTVIPHARDEAIFNPENFHKKEQKSKLGFSDKTVVFFFGSFGPYREHKGVDDLIKSIILLNNPNVVGFIGGCDDTTIGYLRRNFGKYIFPHPKIRFTDLPRILSIADIVVIPLRPTPAGRYQVPAKLFDAMAMEKPIIATNVSDIPMILQNSGYIVEPNNPSHIAQMIKHIIQNPQEAGAKGRMARKLFLKTYSYSAVRKKMIPLFENLL